MEALECRDAALLISAYAGVVVEKMVPKYNGCTMWVSVPSESFLFDEDGIEMCGKVLASRFKSILREFSDIPDAVIKMRIREESWEKELAVRAATLMAIVIINKRK